MLFLIHKNVFVTKFCELPVVPVFFNFGDFCSLAASIFTLQLEAVIMERDIVTCEDWVGG